MHTWRRNTKHIGQLSLDVSLGLAVRREYGVSLVFLVHLHPVRLLHSAKLWFLSFTRLNAESFAHSLIAIVCLFLSLVSIIRDILHSLRSGNLIVEHV